MDMRDHVPEMIASSIISGVILFAIMTVAIIITRIIDAATGRNTTDVPAPWPPKRRRWVRKLIRAITGRPARKRYRR